MDLFYEQSVAGKESVRTTLLYGLCWLATSVLLIVAVVFSAGVFGDDPYAFEFHGFNAFVAFISLSLAVLIFLRKDHLRMEYDYTLRGDELRVCAIMNGRRRKTLAQVKLDHIMRAGEATDGCLTALKRDSAVRTRHWYVSACTYYILYIEDQKRYAALLEMDETLAALIRKELPIGAWHGTEGKIDHASIFG